MSIVMWARGTHRVVVALVAARLGLDPDQPHCHSFGGRPSANPRHHRAGSHRPLAHHDPTRRRFLVRWQGWIGGLFSWGGRPPPLRRHSLLRGMPDPEPGPGDAVIEVRAVALENTDRAIAAGTHYASHRMMPALPAVVGTSGIGVRDDDALVGFGDLRPPYGAMAERVVMPRAHGVPIPDGVDPARRSPPPCPARR